MISKFLGKLKSILFKSAVSPETPLKKKKNQPSLQNLLKQKQKLKQKLKQLIQRKISTP